MELTLPELEAARDFLKQAETTVAAVRGVFLVAGYTEGAARLHDVSGRLTDQITALEKLISATPK